MARVPVLGYDPAATSSEGAYVFTAYARQNGKTSAARAAWERAGRDTGTTWLSGARWDSACDWIDAGIIADSITVTDADLRTAPREDLAALERACCLPGVTVRTSFDGGRRSVIIGPATPCVTSIP